MKNLLRYFPLRALKDIEKSSPTIRGHLSIETRERGKLRQRVEGDNVWTLTGREYLTELIAIKALNPSRATYRADRVAHIGLGTGAQPELSNILSLVAPVVYKTGEYLAPVAAPATFPVTSDPVTGIASKSAVRFTREFGQGEVSLGYDVVLTEAGLFTDGDPNDDWSIPAPTSYASAADRAPVAYKAYEPITKTALFTIRYVWEVRFV